MCVDVVCVAGTCTCVIWCCRYMFYGLLFLPCVKKMAVIIHFVHLADTSSICMHVCHVHMMCVWVMCFVFNYIQQSPKWSLTTTLYLSHTLSTWAKLPPHPQYHILLHVPPMECSPPTRLCHHCLTLHHRVPSLKSQSEMWAPPSTVGAWLHSADTCSFVVLLTRPQSSSMPTTPAAFSSTRSTV